MAEQTVMVRQWRHNDSQARFVSINDLAKEIALSNKGKNTGLLEYISSKNKKLYLRPFYDIDYHTNDIDKIGEFYGEIIQFKLDLEHSNPGTIWNICKYVGKEYDKAKVEKQGKWKASAHIVCSNKHIRRDGHLEWCLNMNNIFNIEKYNLWKQMNIIDKSVYGGHDLLRLPLSKKDLLSDKMVLLPYECSLEDLLISYIPDNSIEIEVEIEPRVQISPAKTPLPKAPMVAEVKTAKCLIDDDKKETIEEIKKLLNILPPICCNDYEKWRNIAFIIYNELGKDGIQVLHEYSSKDDKYKEKSVDDFYGKIKDRTPEQKILTLRTLHHYAKTENLDEYLKSFQNEKIDNLIGSLITSGYNDKNMGELFHQLYNNQVLYTNGSFYILNNKTGFFEQDNKINSILHLLLIDKFYNKVVKLTAEWIEKHKPEILTDDNKHIYEMRESQRVKIIKKLGSRACRDTIAKELTSFHSNEKIVDSFNNVNDMAFAFRNGLYDFQTREFRKAYPEEYITVHTDYDYVPRDKIDSKIINQINDIFKSIFPNEKERDFVLTILSHGLIGKIVREEFYIHKGSGGNGKGLIMTMMKAVLSVYFGLISGDRFTKGSFSSGGSKNDPELATLRYARFCYSEELQKDCLLNEADIKKISGKDTITACQKFEKPFSYLPKFAMNFQTNHKFELTADGGIQRRLVDIPYNMRYLDRNNYTTNYKLKENEGWLDRNLKDYFDNYEYKIALFHILEEYLQKYLKNPDAFDLPDTFKEAKAQTMKDIDPIAKCIDEHYDKTDKLSDVVELRSIKELVKIYSSKKITDKAIKEAIEKMGQGLKIFKNHSGFLSCRGLKEKNDSQKNIDLTELLDDD